MATTSKEALMHSYGRVELDRASLTAKDTATVDATYGSEEQGVIDNNRTRIEEIEDALKEIGVLK